ncbi:hypothetical protein [Thioalkalivibrio sp. ALgr3]|uniref:hypothetical protein n=1 Tax=Thioalkalivibrio sp. ALgr3 TaxID=1239292 RepID=UPI00036FD698|nr:hypothetical protein [Thioalkalivibrio sp. ALgr3]
MTAGGSERAMRIGYECCEHLRARGVSYGQAVADPLIARLLRRTGEAYLAGRDARPVGQEADAGPDPADDPRGMAWWNGLTRQERREWLERAKSARPVDAWRAFRQGPPDPGRITGERRVHVRGVR